MANAKSKTTTTATSSDSLNDLKIEKLTQDYLKKLVKMQLKGSEFSDAELEKEDIEAISDLSLVAVRETVLAIVGACATGYICSGMCEDEED